LNAEAERAHKPFIAELEDALKILGESKRRVCSAFENCPFKAHGVEPSPIICGVCQVHDHYFGMLKTSIYNPLG